MTKREAKAKSRSKTFQCDSCFRVFRIEVEPEMGYLTDKQLQTEYPASWEALDKMENNNVYCPFCGDMALDER